ncbi:MAG: NADH-quinone oxidoreductase subunit N [Prevotella sp.]|nr:NADH-quinone oxidoreductase subunit N [Prevotella sp.]
MNYAQFLNMMPEITLTAILLITFVCDFCSARSAARKWFNPLVAVLLLVHIALNACPTGERTAFGGMYHTYPMAGVMKTLLAVGTLIVVIQSRKWLSRADTAFKEGEYYVILLSTLLGMNIMISSGSFLLFFLGLETASVPMACLVAFDKFRHYSAEAGAKYILTATFSSAVMLYGIAMIYTAAGTLYFDDVAAKITLSPLTILALIFFFSGLAFKISLVPFHFWTADAYQGAPTSVTGYLSVVSKGAAAFTLMVILMKVFGSLASAWVPMMYIVVTASIVLANIMAIRQSELKRFMAFSSISQAGYIMLAVIGNNSLAVSSLTYYILVYIVANLAVFSIIGVVEENNNGATMIEDYNGFYSTNPRLALLMTLSLFSLAGIPPFAGMFSKFFVFMAALKAGGFWTYLVVFIALINTVVSLYYYLLIVKAMYIKNADAPLPRFKSDCNTRLALFCCMAGVLLCGVVSCVYEWINAAVC